MGAMFSQPDVDDEEDSVEEDPDYVAASSSMTLNTNYAKNKLMQFQNQRLTRESIFKIEVDFDKQDKISLIYLLYDDSMAKAALKQTRQVVREALENVLNNWISYVSPRETTWKLKLLEALTIIQHYQALHNLGYMRPAVDARFRPTDNNFSLYIPLERKKLYRMLETFEKEKMNLFLDTVQNDFITQKLVFNRYHYLEMYLLYWASIKYIANGNLDNISRALRIMGLNEEAEKLKEPQPVNDAVLPVN